MPLVSILSVLLTLTGAHGQSAPRLLSFEEAARIALSSNPDLVALRAQEESFKYHSRQALSPNSPVFTVTKQDLPGPEPLSEPAQTNYGLTLTLGFPGKALAASAQAARQADSVREQSLAKEIDLLTSLSNIYASLSVNQKLQKLLREEQKKAAEVLRLIERKYTVAQASQVDLLNAKVVEANLAQAILQAEDDKRTLFTQFLAVIKKPGSREYEPLIPESVVIPPLTRTSDELTELLLRNRHPLKAAVHQREAASEALLSASLSPLPDFQLGGQMNIYHIPSAEPIPGVARDYTVSLGVAIPIFFPINELSGIHAAIRDRDAAESQEESQRISSIADLQSMIVKFQANDRQLKNMESLVLPAAKASYDLTLKTYSLGRADYLRLNDTRSTWIQAQKDYLNLIQSGAQLYNQITQQIGCDLSRQEGPHACI